MQSMPAVHCQQRNNRQTHGMRLCCTETSPAGHTAYTASERIAHRSATATITFKIFRNVQISKYLYCTFYASWRKTMHPLYTGKAVVSVIIIQKLIRKQSIHLHLQVSPVTNEPARHTASWQMCCKQRWMLSVINLQPK